MQFIFPGRNTIDFYPVEKIILNVAWPCCIVVNGWLLWTNLFPHAWSCVCLHGCICKLQINIYNIIYLSGICRRVIISTFESYRTLSPCKIWDSFLASPLLTRSHYCTCLGLPHSFLRYSHHWLLFSIQVSSQVLPLQADFSHRALSWHPCRCLRKF